VAVGVVGALAVTAASRGSSREPAVASERRIAPAPASAPTPIVSERAPAPAPAPSAPAPAPSAPAPAPSTPAPAPSAPAPAPPAALAISLRTTPPGASVVLAGAVVATTPATLTVALPAELTITRAGFRPARVIVDHPGSIDLRLVPLPRPHHPPRERAGETLD
ncbi:MAG TPA: hypothetical protein VFP84_24045, partial [Kofleriaceae bacterium]|nr:hypothetical protein [Kofleriaceae bacterium]